MILDPLKTYADIDSSTMKVTRTFSGVSEIADRYMQRRKIVEVPEGQPIPPAGYVFYEGAFRSPAPFIEPDKSNIDNLDKVFKAIGLVIADLHGLTPSQVKALFKQKYDSLP